MVFTVPGYRIDRLLGAGSQAEVWLAEEVATGERVALKRFAVSTPEAATAARSEAALLAALDHPSLIALRGFLPVEGALVLVLELAEAGTLADLLRRRRILTPPEVVATITPVAAALAQAHDAGLLHGDVSAANILFTRAGRPKLADLGVARMLAAMSAESSAGTALLGTPAYLDPTIAAGGPVGQASDVFSLGAVTLHALTGAGPWQVPGEPAPTVEQVLAVAATGDVRCFAERLRELPAAMAEVLVRALDADPHRRGTAAELALDLGASLPPARVELTGGRIAARGRLDPSTGGTLDGVPTDLTVIARPRTDVAAMLRAGAASSSDDAAQRTRRTWWSRGTAAGSTWWKRGIAALSAWWSAAWRAGSACWQRAVSSRARRRRTRGDAPAVAPSGRGLPGPGRSQPVGRHRPARSAVGRYGRLDGRQRRQGPLRRPRRPARLVIGLLGTGLLLAAGLLGWPHLRHRSAAADTGPTVQRSGVRSPGVVRSTTASPSPAGEPAAGAAQSAGRTSIGPSGAGGPAAGAGIAGTGAVSLADLDRILAGLAAVREQAYAQRRPDLLADVYSAPALLATDTRQLYRSVPAGCGLLGVRTTYRELRLSSPAGPRSMPVTATAVLPAAVLSCQGAVRGHTRSTDPIRLRMVLTEQGDGWRITSEQRV